MIEALTGKVGSGKTLKGTSDSLGHFIKGGCVCTNIEYDRDALARYCWKRGHRFKDSQYVELPMRKDPCFHRYMRQNVRGDLVVKVYIDEAHLFFSAGEYRDLKKEFGAVESFVSQSRRVGCDIYFITQAWENVWGQLRKQALFEVKCRDLRVIEFPMFGTALGGLLGMSWTKVDCQSGAVLESGKTKLARDIFSCYNTMQAYDDAMAEIMATMPVFQRATEKVGLLRRIFGNPDRTQSAELETNS